MRKLIYVGVVVMISVSLIFSAVGCGVYLKEPGAKTLKQEIKAGGGWYWYGGKTLGDSDKAWKEHLERQKKKEK